MNVFSSSLCLCSECVAVVVVAVFIDFFFFLTVLALMQRLWVSCLNIWHLLNYTDGWTDGRSDSIALKVSIKICTRHSANNDRTNQNKKPTKTAMLMDTLITEYNSTKNNKSQSRGGQRTESKCTLFMLVNNLEMHPPQTYIHSYR